EGLSLTVHPSGKKVWRLSYRVDGKQTQDTIGEFPSIGLDEAREVRIQQKRKLSAGVVEPARKAFANLAPSAPVVDLPESGDLGPLWPDLCNLWLEKKTQEGRADKTLVKLRRFLGLTYHHMPDKYAHTISPRDVLTACQEEQDQGRNENATRIRATCGEVLRFALAHGWCDRDVTADLKGALIAPKSKSYAAITDPQQVGQLMRDIGSYSGQFVCRAALLLTARTWLRSSELRLARWDEIDWDNQMWIVPGERMKMKRKHLVPLSSQAMEVLRMLNGLTARKGALIFHSSHRSGRPISNMTMNNALKSMGYDSDRHVPHGFRSTASTNLNELGWNSDWIERQLAHVEGNKVRRAYNAAEYIVNRREMMQFYSDWLDERAAA
ncbi:MAG: tyrosine-type recombinase/integrase, partial [Planctomycetaceae bacterium]